MSVFDVRYNYVSGAIPASVRNCRKIEYFNVHGNRFSGVLPAMSFTMFHGCILFVEAEPWNRFTCPWPAGAKEVCVKYNASETMVQPITDDDCHGTAPPTPPTPAPTPAPAYLCDESTGTCRLDATGTQQQAHCAATCKAMFSCDVSTGRCFVNATGNQTLAQCSSRCAVAPTPPPSVPPTPTPLPYDCDKVSSTCAPKMGGTFTSKSTCMAHCVVPTPPPTPGTPVDQCHACTATPGHQWCWTSNTCLETEGIGECDYGYSVCNSVTYCKYTSCIDPVCGAPSLHKYKCVSNKCIPGDTGVPKAICMANCGGGGGGGGGGHALLRSSANTTIALS